MRGVLREMYREAKARLGDPVAAWAEITGDPERARRYKPARGKGGLVRVPYISIAIFAVGHCWRYRYDKFGWGQPRLSRCSRS